MVAHGSRDKLLRPGTADELAALLRERAAVRVVGANRHHNFLLPTSPDATLVTTRGIAGIVEHYDLDQVVVARAGTTLAELNAALAPSGQCIPHGDGVMPAEDSTLGGLVSMNLPHTLDAQCGSWRDWILGLTVVLADGTIAKGGSLAVKNVAGYDVQKLFIGARGTLGVIVEVILRTFPVKALPSSCAQRGDGDPTGPLWNQRTLRTDFQAASTAPHLVWADPASSTLVAAVPPSESLPRFPHDWVVRSGCAAANLEFADATHVRLMRRAKELLDSQGKLNAGALGVI